MRKFIYLCSHLCVQVPLLPIAVLTVIPLAVCPSWRPWGAADIPVLGNPGVGQWIVIIVVAYTIIDTVRGMIDDLRHGRVGVDLLAVVAIAATVAVQEYWASWAVVLMISSGEASRNTPNPSRKQPDRADDGRAPDRARRATGRRGRRWCQHR